MSKVIVTVAVTGSQPTREMNLNLPVTPQEIADSAIECFNEGASIVHVHVRDPKTGRASMALEHYQEVMERVRAKVPMIINLTTGPGGRLAVDADAQPLPGSPHLMSAQERVAHVLQLRPEMCTLDLGSMTTRLGIMANAQPVVERMAELMNEAGVKPEVELFELGAFKLVRSMIDRGLLDARCHLQLCMGTSGGIPADPRTAQLMIDSVPSTCTWSIFGVARTQFSMVAMGVMNGGHVRVGMEDNIYLRKGQLTSGNAELVRNAVQIIRNMGAEVASVEEARQMLGLAAH